MKRSPVKSHPTLREHIVEHIKDAIVSGNLRPGERVPEPEIAQRFGVSRTPIREAFRQLESEGFIVITPRKGAIVSPITEKDVREFYAIKSLLESYAARKACPRFTDKDITRLEHLNNEMHRCAKKNDTKGFFRLDNQFHETFLKACENEKLRLLINHLIQQFERFRFTALSLPGRMSESARQHTEIIKAFMDKDEGLVERLVRANAERGCEILVHEIGLSNPKGLSSPK
ncbi:MAG: GntR family transcriptional regulator [Deltaproteobacteria bacterium]|nr:GntR family transcriptional regulator [Deltaproteobacteria bacterium]